MVKKKKKKVELTKIALVWFSEKSAVATLKECTMCNVVSGN